MSELTNMYDEEKRNIIHSAILSGNNQIIQRIVELLKQNRQILQKLLCGKDSKANTPLHLASQLGKLGTYTKEFVALYSDKDLLAKNELDQNPFHIASKHGNLLMVETLLKRDHKTEEVFLLNSLDIDSNTPLHLAAANKQVAVVKILLAQGSDPKALNSIGWSPVSCASKAGDLESLSSILSSADNMNIDSSDNNNTTSLHLAAKDGHDKVIEYLLGKGADITVKDYKDRNPLEMAIEKGNR